MRSRRLAAVAVAAAACTLLGFEAPASAQTIPLPTLKDGGAPRCALAETVVLGRDAWARRVVAAFRRQGGLALWLTGRNADTLAIRALTAGGRPRGEVRPLKLAKTASLHALVGTPEGFLLLYRTPIGKVFESALGEHRDSITFWAQAFGPDGKLAGQPRKLADAHWHATGELQWRDGAAHAYLDLTRRAGESLRREAILSPAGAVVTSRPDRGDWYTSGFGPHKRGDEFLFVAVSRGYREPWPFTFFRKGPDRKPIGEDVKLPFAERDIQRVRETKDRLEFLDLDPLGVKLEPTLAWNGESYFIATPQARGRKVAQTLHVVRCGGAGSPVPASTPAKPASGPAADDVR